MKGGCQDEKDRLYQEGQTGGSLRRLMSLVLVEGQQVNSGRSLGVVGRHGASLQDCWWDSGFSFKGNGS